MRVLLLSLGATMFQRCSPITGRMELLETPQTLLASIRPQLPADILVTAQALPFRSGAELQLQTVLLLRDRILQALDSATYDAFVVAVGTDTMDECAFALQLMLEPVLRSSGLCVAVTGAMKPADQLGADGPANLRDALRVAADPGCRATHSVLVVMNDSIHLAQHVAKRDSQLVGAFASVPSGPLGQLRERVIIWTVTVSAALPPEALLESLDGLVLAAPGSGSLPASLMDALSPGWTGRLPIAIASRCGAGANHDDFYYRGSLAKYESRGFLLRGGYEHLTPLQARTLLVLRLSALGHG